MKDSRSNENIKQGDLKLAQDSDVRNQQSRTSSQDVFGSAAQDKTRQEKGAQETTGGQENKTLEGNWIYH